MRKLDWKSYEELVKDIYEQLGSNGGVKILGHGNDCKYKGKSGVEHQIDVLTSHSDGLHTYITDIECKYWEEHINKDIVMKVDSIVKDCNFSKGIIVSKRGFTPDAIAYAKHIGVGLVELREMTDEDWKGRIRKMVINYIVQYPELTSVHIEIEDNSVSEVKKESIIANIQQVIIYDRSTGPTTLAQLIEDDFFKELRQKQPGETLKKSYQFGPDASITCQEQGTNNRLKSIKMSGVMKSINETDVISDDNRILYYMKCIFEKIEIFLNANGQIVKMN